MGVVRCDVIGIAFNSHFTRTCEGIERGDGREDAGKFVWCEERRCPPTEVNMLNESTIRELPSAKVKLPDQGVDKVLAETATRLRVEVAVGATTGTEGDVKI